jgi:hypothetical protein
MTSEKIWDVTQSYEQNRITTRSSASSVITRKEVRFQLLPIDEIKSERPVFCLHNANGAQMHFYPFFVILNNGTQDYGLVDYKDLTLTFSAQRFIEEAKVPFDTQVIDKTWAKVNKDGSPDRRFTGNYQIPVVKYGELSLTTLNGLNECYHFSNFEASYEFVNALNEFKAAINSLERIEAPMQEHSEILQPQL